MEIEGEVERERTESADDDCGMELVEMRISPWVFDRLVEVVVFSVLYGLVGYFAGFALVDVVVYSLLGLTGLHLGEAVIGGESRITAGDGS